MSPETTLFGVLLVLAISLTLILLLIKKPHFHLKGTPAENARREQKSRKDKEETQSPKTSLHRFRYRPEIPEKAPIPQQHSSSAKTEQSEIGSNARPILIPKEEKPKTPFPTVQTPESPKKPPESVEAPKIIEEKRAPPPTARPQMRPASCVHFFGYLRKIPKNASMPDECFGCPKMVECLYFNPSPE
jgi:hypothetical protein